MSASEPSTDAHVIELSNISPTPAPSSSDGEVQYQALATEENPVRKKSKSSKKKGKKATKDARVSPPVDLGSPPDDEDAYFANYDDLFEAKDEAIIVATSGISPVFATRGMLEASLQQIVRNKAASTSKRTTPVWVDIQFPTVETMLMIAKYFKIHALTIEDCLSETEDEQQKNELFENYRFVSFTEYYVIPQTNIWGNVDVHMILPEGPNLLISLHNGPANFVAQALRVLKYESHLDTTKMALHAALHAHDTLDNLETDQLLQTESSTPRKSKKKRRLSESSTSSNESDSADLLEKEEKGQGSFKTGLKRSAKAQSSETSSTKSKPKKQVPDIEETTEKNDKVTIHSSYWMTYVIMDCIVHGHIQMVNYCTREVALLDELVLVLHAREQSDLLRRIGNVRKRIGILQMQLMRKKDIIGTIIEETSEIDDLVFAKPRIESSSKITSSGNQLSSSPSILDAPSTSKASDAPNDVLDLSKVHSIHVFLQDILDHISGMLFHLEQDKDSLINLTNAYSAKVSVQMSLFAQEQNSVMKKFSAMATIILPVALVPALWGMNVPIPGQYSSGHWVFWTIVGSMLAASFVAGIIFWRIGWFS